MNHKKIVDHELNNAQLRENLSNAMHALQKNKQKITQNRFIHWEKQREIGKKSKNKTLNSLYDRVLEFEENAKKNGYIVHWAKNGDEACEIVHDIMKEKGLDTILKQKTMASEEIGLNHYLQEKGMTALETDLGEVIIQLIDDKPVHIVVPAIHKNRYEIGEIFHDKLGAPKESDPVKLNAIARDYMREKFKKLKIGLTGGNFLIAKEGAIWLVENEGNGRMCNTIPDVLISVCGIEKVVDTIEDAATLVGLLTPSATGQFIANYNNIICGPRREGELDGPKECHIILFDNHRTDMLAHEEYYEALRCIRCGTCMNFCPVYDKIGGHSYQSVYPGPIGEVISPQIFGLDKHDDVLTLCSLCGRCSEVCPVKIPLADIIRKLRRDKIGQGKNPPYGSEKVVHNGYEKMIFKGFTFAATHGFVFRKAAGMAVNFNNFIHKNGGKLPVLKNWFAYRDLFEFDYNLNENISKVQGVQYE